MTSVLLMAFLIGVMVIGRTAASEPGMTYLAASSAESSPLFGVNFMSSAEDRAAESKRTPESIERQYQNGLATGASWNRWPLYWNRIEVSPGVFNWSTQDATVAADIAHGLNINAILLGTPGFYQTGDDRSSSQFGPRNGGISLDSPQRATPVGLYEPVFDDQTDIPGPGKKINASNKWAVYVSMVTNRYRPGGILAQSKGWTQGQGITHWEMWNEPDLNGFWDDSVEDYARLLKVGYLAAKHIDPQASILFGGLANFAKPFWYRDVLDIYDSDGQAAANGYFHDIVATHNYFQSWQSFNYVLRARNAMSEHGLDKPVWLNETGVAAWDDYPGPVWDSLSALRATTSEQADFLIQSTMYSLFAGAEAIYHFQLYDGCGNQPGGTDFPPHNGELCDANGDLIGQPGIPCAGDANGLYTNPTDALCFTQHPQPESPRPNLAAYQVITHYLQDIEPTRRERPGEATCSFQIAQDNIIMVPPQEWLFFYRQATKERVVGLWALCEEDQTAHLQATNPAGTARLVTPDGQEQTISAVNGFYEIHLPGATHRNPFLNQTVSRSSVIGGRPVILVESDEGNLPPTPTVTPTVTPIPDLPMKSYLPSVQSAP